VGFVDMAGENRRPNGKYCTFCCCAVSGRNRGSQERTRKKKAPAFWPRRIVEGHASWVETAAPHSPAAPAIGGPLRRGLPARRLYRASLQLAHSDALA
jgi:hypothetical protein